jgi:alkylation response protein AidB-like acyl-CoA dehydrogenase
LLTLSYQETARSFLAQNLKPLVSAIDVDAFYPEQVLQDIGRAGLYGQPNLSVSEFWPQTLGLIEETASICGSTAFALWCHTTAMIYVRHGQSSYLKREILPKLASGEILGASGLSNPVKFYAGMEDVRLHAKKVSDGYQVSGFLPFVSNLGEGHWFGIVAEVDESQRIIGLVPCNAEGLRISELRGFLGLNGSATYNCHFRDVFVPNEWILNEDADEFIGQIRDEFVLNQAGLGIGLANAAIHSMNVLKEKQNGANQFLRIQPEDLEARLDKIQAAAYELAGANIGAGEAFGTRSGSGTNGLNGLNGANRVFDARGAYGMGGGSGSDEINQDYSQDYARRILQVRLESAYLALDAANAGMLHCGGAAYVKKSSASRRLREAYFVAVVTPAVKQLEKLLQVGW